MMNYMVKGLLAAVLAAAALFLWALSKEIEAFCEMEDSDDYC